MKRALCILAIGVMMVSTVGVFADETDPKTDADLREVIDDLSSDDGHTRITATRAVFAQGSAALKPLRVAGARHIVTDGTISSPRKDVVYSLLVGLKEEAGRHAFVRELAKGKPPSDEAPRYFSDSLGLHVQDGTTKDDIVEMGRKYGFTLADKFKEGDSRPNCYVRLDKDKILQVVMKELLVNEPKIVTVTLGYFE